MQELWRVWSTPSLPSLLGPLWPQVIGRLIVRFMAYQPFSGHSTPN